jgi:hypothetical protein
LGFRAGFTHMEWYRMASGEAVFGEIAARPPGRRVVELMNYSCDADLYVGWAEAVLHGHLRAPITQKFNSGNVFKRAHGAGHISAIEGLDGLLQRYGEHVMNIDLLPLGAPRRDWRTHDRRRRRCGGAPLRAADGAGDDRRVRRELQLYAS